MFEEDCRRGQVSSAVKFEAFAEEWFREYASLNLKNTTYVRQRQLTKRVYEAIGHIRLDKLTTREIQKFINSLSKEGTNERTGKGLSHKTMLTDMDLLMDSVLGIVKTEVIRENAYYI